MQNARFMFGPFNVVYQRRTGLALIYDAQTGERLAVLGMHEDADAALEAAINYFGGTPEETCYFHSGYYTFPFP